MPIIVTPFHSFEPPLVCGVFDVIQRVASQRYRTPILRVIVTASRNVFESDSIGMPSWRDWKLVVVVVMIGWRPQRWERVR